VRLDCYIGVPFAEANCWQLIRRIYSKELGIILPLHDTVDIEDGEGLQRAITGDTGTDMWRMVDLGQERTFDVLIMLGAYFDGAGTRKLAPIHCGMVVKPGMLIHVEPGQTSVCLSYTHPSITLRRIKQVWRHRSQA